MRQAADSIDAEIVSANQMEPTFAIDTAGTVAFANQRFYSVYGLSPESTIGADLGAVRSVVDDGFEGLERAVWAILDGDSAEERVEITTLHPVELQFPRRLPVEARVTPITSEGTDLGALVSFRRIDERKAYERQLERQNERLEEFADVVAHDLRNPLSVADGRLELLADEHDSEHIEAVQNALGRMRAIVDETLTLAKQGRYVGEKSVVSLPGLIERCWETVETPGVRLSVETDASVLADADRLRHLFENLFRNSVEHSSTDTRRESGDSAEHDTSDAATDTNPVTVRVGNLRDDEGPTGFYVEDDGPGIPPDKHDRVFEPGYSTVADGTGYGLAIVTWIAEAHDWSVSVTESAAGGARFEFTGVAFA
jgi:signal transduction histidine kinase